MERNPGLALMELDKKLSREEFLKNAGSNPEIIILFATNGECSSYHLDELKNGLAQIRRNEWYANASRFVFLAKKRTEGIPLRTSLEDGAQIIQPRSVRGFAEFAARLDRQPLRSQCSHGITVLKEFETTLYNGSRSPVLIVRNDFPETRRVEMDVDFWDGAEKHIGHAWCYAVLGPDEVGILHYDKLAFGYGYFADGVHAVRAGYELSSRKWPYGALSGMVGVNIGLATDAWKSTLEVRNNGSRDAYIKCVHVFGMRHERDGRDALGSRLREVRQLESIVADVTLRPGETYALLSDHEWRDYIWEAFPVGWLDAR